jgi:hypothetical protein
MKIQQSQINAARSLVLEHYDEGDIRLVTDFKSRWGYTSQIALVGAKSALEEFELYLAASFLTPFLDGEVQASDLIKSIMDIRELRHEDELGYDEVIFYYPQFEVVE